MYNLKSSWLLLAALAVFTFSGCTEDISANEEVNNRLAGNWEVESFTLDGVEQMQFTMNSFEMEFTKQGPEDGETEWTLIDVFGATTNVEGDYSIENEGREIDVDGDDFDIDVDGDELEISGNVDGTRWIIKADRD